MATTLPVTTQQSLPISNITGLARALVRNHLLDETTLLKTLDEARKEKQPLMTTLVKNRLVSSRKLAYLAAQEFNCPLLDLGALSIEVAPIKLVSEELIRQHHALPLYQRGKRLFIGLTDPSNLRALDDIKFQSGLNTEPIVVVEEQLDEAIDKAFEHNSSEAVRAILDEDLEDLDISGDPDDAKNSDVTSLDKNNEAPVVRFINKIILDAARRGVSDIHFEPYENHYRVRYRQDGLLHEVTQPPTAMAARIGSRLKVMSRLDIAERRLPQDGRINIRLSRQRNLDFRVSTLPTLYGEKIVLRILDPASAYIGVDALGFEEKQKRLFLKAINKPQGMVLVTGPTGSGKTVTLYTALNLLNTDHVNISTAEDPVEINLPGINQVGVNTKIGMTFATSLRAFLRQDPDIIMVGEIRDLETAEIAIKAAQTGHMVLSTLHTNDAPQTLTRLANMGVATYNIAASISLIMAQRLARCLCDNCKLVEEIPPEALLQQGFKESELPNMEIYHANHEGCDSCFKGYKGRIGIFEVMQVSETMGQIIMRGGNSQELADQAQREGVNNLRRSGLNKVRQGITSLEEINRITKD